MARRWWVMPIILPKRSDGSKFKASLGKYFLRPYLGLKKKSQERAGEVVQVIRVPA
jgi:hypothetical protein